MHIDNILQKAFKDYVAAEFPEEGTEGSAFIETPAIDHFEAGWLACKKHLEKLLEGKI